MPCQHHRARNLARQCFLATIHFVLLCTGVVFVPTSAHATTAAGRTKGSFAVAPTGAASYNIPIWAPPGPQGMQPQITLTYNNQMGNGPVGVGWSISGLSSIYRCNLTYAQDAAPAPVALVTGDGYCMDGQRLRLTSTGNYGEAGSTYQTEIANFVNVTASGTAGNGPAYFTAKDRNGRTYTYGNGGNSQVLATGTSTALSWQLNEVSDPAGNTMTISYTTATGAAVPATISWTPTSHGASTYAYTMAFAYSTNVPQSSIYKYAAGTVVTNTNLLSSITIAYSGTTVKKYVLSYQASPTTGRDELIKVQECADSGGTNCLLPTTITYQNGQAGTSTSATSALSSAPSQLVALYDFNGDGLTDLAYCNGSTIYVSFASATGYLAPVNTGAACGALYGNLLGESEDGILANNGGTWYYYNWNGSSFTGTSTGLAYDSSATQYLLADIDGDGRPDLIELVATPAVGYAIYSRLNTSSTSSVSFSSTRVTALSGNDTELVDASIASASNGAIIYGTLRRLDFNGDGREDILFHRHDQTTTLAPQGSPPPPGIINIHILEELLSNGSTFTPFQIVNTSSLSNIAFLNWNSDACTDYVVNGSIYISGCNGSAPSSISLGSSTVIGAMDWDGDGRTDVLIANGSTIGVYLSTGDGISNLVTTSVPYSTSDQYFTFDANGDGLDDIGVWNQTTHTVSYFAHNAGGQPPDLVSSVTDGFGNSVSPTYVSLLQNNYTKTGYGTPTYPYKIYMEPSYVVSQAIFSDPSTSGGTYNQTYEYYEAWTNIQGRGWQAFYSTTALDSRTALVSAQEFERTFPTAGMVAESYLQTSAPVNLSVTINTLPGTITELSSTPYQQRYFPYFINSTTTKREFGGTENGDLISTSSTNYTFDNYGNATSISTTVTDNDPGSPYTGDAWTATTTNTPDVDTTNWCLGLFTETQVAYSSTLSGSNSVTRTKTATPDTTNCRYTEVITEPSSSKFKVTEDFTYDSFGNVATDKITGINMTARQTTTSWTTSSATTGQFPMSVTDPTNATTQYNYNFSYGLKSSVIDPNGLTTSWQYTDGFGRKNQETRPDGTYTTWSYQNCAGNTGCLVGSNGLVITQDVYSSQGTLQSGAAAYLDSIDRVLVTNQSLLANGTIPRNEQRYDSLGRVSQRAFPCAWTSLTTTCTYWTTNTYDVLNRLTQSQRPISSTNSNLQTTTYAYAGRTTTVTDPYSHSRTTVTDVNGWPRQTEDAYSYRVTLAYDAAGAKTKVTDSLSNTLWSGTYNYGLAAFRASATDMDMGAWSFTPDALGEETGWTDAKGQSFSESYDALSRPLTRTEPDLFTQWTWGSSSSSHNIGKLQSVCTGTGNNPTACAASGYSETETYDNLARRSTRAITIPGQSNAFTYTWTYDPHSGLLSTLTYPTSTSSYALELQYGYSQGILQTITDISDTPNVTVWQANTMNPAAQITEETLGNGIVTNRSFDAVTGWLGTAQSGVNGGAGVKNLAFLYDEMGDVTQRQDNNLGLTENIYYDNDYRFSYSTLNSTQNLSVTYDNTGNITSRSDVANGATWTYSPTQKHAVTQAGSSAYQYAYDANGNATSRQGNSITWSSYNYPITVNAGSGSTAETVAFEYGPNRQRWQQSYTGNSTTETTNYIGERLEMVISGGVTDYRHYISGGSGVVAVYSRKSSGTNTFSYILSDHQASAASITNSSGAQVIGESFTAFGSRRNPITWSGAATNSDLTTIAGITREGYTFQTALGLWMGMNHLNGRVQDAVTGRMLSADPHITDPTSAQNYNRYSYVLNNPLSLIDPTGFDQHSGDWDVQKEQGMWYFASFGQSNSWSAGAMYGVSGVSASSSSGSGATSGSGGTGSGGGGASNPTGVLGDAGSIGAGDQSSAQGDGSSAGPPAGSASAAPTPYQGADGMWTVEVATKSPTTAQQIGGVVSLALSDPLWYLIVNPAFGWVDCPRTHCAPLKQGAWMMVPAFAGLAAAAAAPGVVAGVSTVQQSLPGLAVAATLETGGEATVTTAASVGVQGADDVATLGALGRTQIEKALDAAASIGPVGPQ